MGSWKKYFTEVPDTVMVQKWLEKNQGGSTSNTLRNNQPSYLYEVYAGPSNRLERYNQYDIMDTDSIISAALDTISEFCTQKEEKSKEYFEFDFKEEASEAEIEVLSKKLREWTEINDFDKRLRGIIRQCLKYGDSFFVRDPETYRWLWVDPYNVERVVVDEAAGKKPEEYWIKNPDLNLQSLSFTQASSLSGTQSYPTGYLAKQPRTAGSHGVNTTTSALPSDTTAIPVPATYVVHFSLSEGLDINWPFGNSILEPVYKSYKQKELLEDAILIYRIHRAPERRVFYVDTGNMPPHKIMAFLEQIKNEINQRRIPTKTGGGQSILDSTFNPQCIDLNTKIPLLDSRTLTLNELITEYINGKENWVYSTNPVTGNVQPGKISWAGITRKNAEVYKLTLDNGKELIVTPDHKIPVLGKGFVEAQDLTLNDSLISFETKFKQISSSGNDYEMIYDHELNDWIYTHRMVTKYINLSEYVFEDNNEKKSTIHHIDWNRYNNDPNNLVYMGYNDHMNYHYKTNFWNTASDEAVTKAKNKISQSLIKYHSTVADEVKQKDSIDKKQRMKKYWKEFKNSEKYRVWQENISKSRKDYIQNNPEFKERLISFSTPFEKGHSLNQEFIWTFDMIKMFVDVLKNEKEKNSKVSRNTIVKLLNENEDFIKLMKINNIKSKGTSGSLKNDKFTQSKVIKLYKEFNVDNWNDFKEKIDYFNHKIVSIEKVENRDTGCITVDNDYHTFATDAGIFIKNSMTEDFIFPQNADGRGSRVESLPGGENLGQINDLDYFNNNLKQGLQIPSSYISGGGDDNAVYNDGRATTALIAEYRFQKYCERIQSLVNDVFDKEFKLYLKGEGVQVDAGLYQLILNVPQNFAKYRQIELDNARIGTWQSIAETPYISKRFAMKRWLGLTEDEIVENEKMWKEENPDKELDMQDEITGAGDLGTLGIRPELGGQPPMGDEFDMGDFGEPGLESPITGNEQAPGATGGIEATPPSPEV